MIDNLNTYRKYDLISCPEPETEDNNLNDVDWSSKSTSKVKYIHYYVNDNYIEYEEVGEDQLESLDLNGYEIIDYIVNHEGS